jgi:hypothetical protein
VLGRLTTIGSEVLRTTIHWKGRVCCGIELIAADYTNRLVLHGFSLEELTVIRSPGGCQMRIVCPHISLLSLLHSHCQISYRRPNCEVIEC